MEAFQQYAANVSDTVALYGGKTIAVNKDPSALYGSVDIDASVIQEWPTLEAAQAWLDSPEYAPLKQLRDDRALSDLKIIPVPALS